MPRQRDTGEKATFLMRDFLKRKFLDHSASFVYRYPFTAGRESQKQIAHCLLKIGLKPGMTCLISSEVSKLICDEHFPFQLLQAIQNL